jgi:hypothetical protein
VNRTPRLIDEPVLMQRKRLVSLLSVLPVLAGLCVVAYKFGPSPARIVKPQTVEAAPVAAVPKTQSEVPENSRLFELFGMHQTAVARGKVAVTPAEYLNSLEAVYVQRGYRRLETPDPNTKPKGKRGRRAKEEPPVKFFQRDDTGGIANLSATGPDADYSSNEIATEPYTFSTLVVPVAGGGSEWSTYRLSIDPGKLAQLERPDQDFPGFDPANVPRMPGLQRIYAHSSGSASVAIYKSKEVSDVALLSLYLQQMPRHGWVLDDVATAAVNKVVSGAMSFTQGARSCLIWVTPDKDAAASVTISSH